MNTWKNFIFRMFDTKETAGGFIEPVQSILAESETFFPGFQFSFWSINSRKNEVKIYRLTDKKIDSSQIALTQFKFEHLLKSKERPIYSFETQNRVRILIPLFVDGVLSGCLAVSSSKKKTINAWKSRLPYFYIIAKRFLKVLELHLKNTAIETLMEINQDLEVKFTATSLSLEQEKLAHLQAGKMATLGEVAVGIAHEINNPLTLIASRVGYLEKNLEKKNQLNPDVVESIRKINQTVDRIVKIINGLRHFAYTGSDKKSPVPLSRVISDSLDLCQDRIKRNETELKILNDGYDVEISVYDTQMIQVLLNLIINSLDAVKDLSERWIEIEYKIEKENLNIIVRDSGHGLDADVAEKIMNPFFTTKASGQGTGLGLSLSKSIIENHEGRLFYNAGAKNTEFVIEIPYMRQLTIEAK